jgi:hypothetical protein
MLRSLSRRVVGIVEIVYLVALGQIFLLLHVPTKVAISLQDVHAIATFIFHIGDLFELSTLMRTRRSRKASSYHNKGSTLHNRAKGLGRWPQRETTKTRAAGNDTIGTHRELEQDVSSSAHLETTGAVNESV